MTPPSRITAPPPRAARREEHDRRRRMLRTRVAHEPLRRPVAPLRLEAFLGAQQVAAVRRVEAVGVGPALVDAAPRVAPVVIDLAAEQVAADSPHVVVLAERLEILVILED